MKSLIDRVIKAILEGNTPLSREALLAQLSCEPAALDNALYLLSKEGYITRGASPPGYTIARLDLSLIDQVRLVLKTHRGFANGRYLLERLKCDPIELAKALTQLKEQDEVVESYRGHKLIPPTSTAKVQSYRQRQLEHKRTRRDYYLTDEENTKLRTYLRELRKEVCDDEKST